jgi:hypothetical protein
MRQMIRSIGKAQLGQFLNIKANIKLRSGDGQRGPHGMRASGLSPFIFAMRVCPFLAKEDR